MSAAITPCLWFDDQAEPAARYYCDVFKDAAIDAISRYGEGAPLPAGTALTVNFTLRGRPFTALNGGPHFTFSEAVSFVVECDDQGEIDHYWTALGDGGSEQQCGWLKDRYGLSWQIVPRQMAAWMSDADPQRVNRVMQALMQMIKIDIATLERAYAN
ncbi:VOC family protein [Polycyclovorans algicola]|uniref:VOC family protein n=1 Tax=Polycyclovorans algicola TaxID=616992 RepID=UPI0004A767B9|nr:VOC family protein [Polycyclovorans algicola]